MKMLAMLTMSAAVLASTTVFTNAFAQETTRAEVRQELIQAENNGSRFVSNTSYPDVAPIFENQVARLKAQHADSGEGPAMSGTSQSGHRIAMPGSTSSKPQTCVGPVSFCNIYFGS
ncbi:DUF4148 domain-containing protein [Paraburkholderia rhizosphaerae]|uniref:Uncharacterized protein DUF4148 n=1 Tax=Paraburkholderia rhizosphaerae TaxID=480658 RepID=A0A4R8LZY1_9BURK|nr:DUF4148 domain-containing protein [Paraburkholderia rhizosphaerae]TDY52320.1 uncharacterized protein DUF4148 [Paraburkholderia rhizosphaerae]